jgi:hypothetical protein
MLLIVCSLPQCTMPTFVAKRTDNLDLPVAGVTGLVCTSHNGNIVLAGAATQPAIRVRAELSVRGHSQQEADDNLRLMEVGHEVKDGVLHLAGKYPKGSLNNVSPSFAFHVELPSEFTATLTTHNGNIQISGLDGRQKLLTHNGGITTRTPADRIDCETHNGRIALALASNGSVAGRIESHNGGVEIELGSAVTATLAAETHNGSITVPETAKILERKNNRLRCEIGDGRGNLTITTHNGSIRIK